MPSLMWTSAILSPHCVAAQPLHPEKVKYYGQRRDPDFESKMREVLLVYREVAWQHQSPWDGVS